MTYIRREHWRLLAVLWALRAHRRVVRLWRRREGNGGRGTTAHVDRVRHTHVRVKATVHRVVPIRTSQVPFTNHAGGVTCPLDEFGQRRLVQREPAHRLRAKVMRNASPQAEATCERQSYIK